MRQQNVKGEGYKICKNMHVDGWRMEHQSKLRQCKRERQGIGMNKGQEDFNNKH